MRSPDNAEPTVSATPADGVVELYCRERCAKCARVQRWLEGLGIHFQVRDVVHDRQAQQTVSRLGFRSLPVVVTPDGRAATGWDTQALVQELPFLAQVAEHASLDAQRQHWETMLATHPEMFGLEPSYAAQRAAEVFAQESKRAILELGAGQGRDALFFARQGLQVTALDYSAPGVAAIAATAKRLSLSDTLATLRHDVREPLPFPNETFDACYSHMLYCMALNSAELDALSNEIWRVLRPGGLNVYTARNTSDAHYGQGAHHGDDLYEMGGFIVHFFSPEKIQRLARGYEIVEVDQFEEGGLPRRLSLVMLRKPLKGDGHEQTTA
ncbi:MAG: methyltransferase domain-containing protein [Chloroflexi bacterium]|nr:methyltransferase domain-containing protein [Chloroflexota bacterium]